MKNQSHLNFFKFLFTQSFALLNLNMRADDCLTHDMKVFMKHKVATRFLFIEVKDCVLLIFLHGIYIALV